MGVCRVYGVYAVCRVCRLLVVYRVSGVYIGLDGVYTMGSRAGGFESPYTA